MLRFQCCSVVSRHGSLTSSYGSLTIWFSGSLTILVSVLFGRVSLVVSDHGFGVIRLRLVMVL